MRVVSTMMTSVMLAFTGCASSLIVELYVDGGGVIGPTSDRPADKCRQPASMPCRYEYVQDSRVEIDAVADEGWRFVEFLEDCANLGRSPELEMTSSRRCGARFEEIPTDGSVASRFTISPEAPRVGQLVTFDGTGSLPSGSIVEYRWVIGSGPEELGSVVTRRFEEEGLVSVSLTVSDASGEENTLSRMLQVFPVPPFTTVTLELRNAMSGEPINGESFLQWESSMGTQIESCSGSTCSANVDSADGSVNLGVDPPSQVEAWAMECQIGTTDILLTPEVSQDLRSAILRGLDGRPVTCRVFISPDSCPRPVLSMAYFDINSMTDVPLVRAIGDPILDSTSPVYDSRVNEVFHFPEDSMFLLFKVSAALQDAGLTCEIDTDWDPADLEDMRFSALIPGDECSAWANLDDGSIDMNGFPTAQINPPLDSAVGIDEYDYTRVRVASSNDSCRAVEVVLVARNPDAPN